ncbi:hypothetical protein RRG08_066598 [Elysia crispata]|uniref:Uncharacterized protein n=1 Tax=Elysia crispata TaxID=231223 RepID=A0AAE1CMY1_9GAST|nr:hypothetical protein RRG08_066598 [Elysia crispata]
MWRTMRNTEYSKRKQHHKNKDILRENKAAATARICRSPAPDYRLGDCSRTGGPQPARHALQLGQTITYVQECNQLDPPMLQAPLVRISIEHAPLVSKNNRGGRRDSAAADRESQ